MSRSLKLKKIHDKHKPIVDMIVAGLSNLEIAERVGYHKSFISALRNSDIIRAEVARRRGDVEQAIDIRLGLIAEKSLAGLEEMVEADGREIGHSVKLNACVKALQFAGFEPAKKLSHEFQLTSADVDRIKKISAELKVAEPAIDAEFELGGDESEGVDSTNSSASGNLRSCSSNYNTNCSR